MIQHSGARIWSKTGFGLFEKVICIFFTFHPSPCPLRHSMGSSYIQTKKPISWALPPEISNIHPPPPNPNIQSPLTLTITVQPQNSFFDITSHNLWGGASLNKKKEKKEKYLDPPRPPRPACHQPLLSSPSHSSIDRVLWWEIYMCCLVWW